MIKVYGAGIITEAQQWVDLAKNLPEFEWTATWPKLILANVPDHESHAPDFWILDELEIAMSDVLLLYRWDSAGTPYRGALVEVGIAIGRGLPVFITGICPEYSTWQYHPLVRRCPSLTSAMIEIERLDRQMVREDALVDCAPWKQNQSKARLDLQRKLGYHLGMLTSPAE